MFNYELAVEEFMKDQKSFMEKIVSEVEPYVTVNMLDNAREVQEAIK